MTKLEISIALEMCKIRPIISHEVASIFNNDSNDSIYLTILFRKSSTHHDDSNEF